MTLETGSLLKGGDFRIVKVLGQGGFGITYLAEQVSLGRKVAVKEFFMKEHCNRDGQTSHVSVGSEGSRELVERFRQKFLREAKMIASFDNPHIVRVHDVFEENGTAYYVMEYLPGGSLSDRVRQSGGLPESEAVVIIKKIADALAYIHGQNVLHLDVKPANVMFSKNNEPVLVDFGISKHYDEAGHQTSSTPVGISKGFAPLEQYRSSDVSSFTPATDVYSLGATLFYLLTGTVPPEASDVNEDGLPPLPSNISASVRAAVTAAMQPRRKERPQSIAGFMELLGSPVAGKKSEPWPSDDVPTVIDIPEPKQPTHPQKPKPVKPVQPKKPQPPKTKPQKPSGADNLGPQKPPVKGVPKWLYATLAALVAALVVELVIVNGGNDNHDSLSQISATGNHNGREYVDLGLPSGLLWATCNVGASSPSEYGNYYAWGETGTKSDYSWENLKYRTSGDSYDNVKFSKYVAAGRYGNVDNKTRLDMSDDAARANWGGNWRMPTVDEWKELNNNCTWTWTRQRGHRGYKVTGKNGAYIFLPAAGFRNGSSLYNAGERGDYWSSSLYTDYSYYAFYCFFYSGGVYPSDWGYRYYGQSVRPVVSALQK